MVCIAFADFILIPCALHDRIKDREDRQEDDVKKVNCGILCTMTALTLFLAVGCGTGKSGTEQGEEKTETEIVIENGTEELKEMHFSAEELGDVPTVITEYAEEEEAPELAAFLTEYYKIPEEYQKETRYYYNLVDLNDDGTDEIFALVVGDYTEGDAGNPALILEKDDKTFHVLESFEEIRTPVTISENTTNGWHDIILNVYGKGVDTGYLICSYQPNGGYQTESNAFVTELEPMSSTQILSNNLIDDMDQGRYFTLKK